MKKRKTYKKKKIIFIIPILIICSFLIYFNSNYFKLKKLGYDNVSIKLIKKEGITNNVLKNKYSKVLQISLKENKFIKKNLNNYYELIYKNDKSYIDNVNKLISIGYNSSEINYIINKLTTKEINILDKYTYINDLKSYLDYEMFDINKMERYINYKKKNNLDYKSVVMNVNMNLDYNFYELKLNVEYKDYEKLLVNKYYKLDDNYIPNNLVKINNKFTTTELKLQKDAKEKFEEMCTDALNLSLVIKGISAYRTKDYQLSLYNSYVKKNGKEYADKYSARSRHSEHETGLAIDVKGTGKEYTKFENTEEYKWLKDNAHKYGFILRYPKDKEKVTGYNFESWHIRYVGKKIAKIIYEKNLTYEEYYVLYINNNGKN